MTWTRRDLLKTAAVSGAVVTACALASSRALADFTHLKSKKKLKILILGGTAFLGPAVVNLARSRGHEVTLFNRGKTNNELFPDLVKLVGDRDGDLAALETGTWDVCLDTSGYIPHMVTDSAELLKGRVGQYIFISSISVYADFKERGLNIRRCIPEIIARSRPGRAYQYQNEYRDFFQAIGFAHLASRRFGDFNRISGLKRSSQ